jgi:hypothetical protein
MKTKYSTEITVLTLKMAVFWDVTLCRTVNITEELTAFIIRVNEAVSSSETSVSIHKNTN